IVAVAGACLFGGAVYFIISERIKLGIAAACVCLPALCVGYSILDKKKQRWPKKIAVEEPFNQTMDFYNKHGEMIKASLEKEVNDLEESLAKLDKNLWRREITMPAVTNKERAFIELTDNMTFFREQKTLI